MVVYVSEMQSLILHAHYSLHAHDHMYTFCMYR